ncbi:MAG: hypothetical protein ABIX01_12275 [Chitinophagaceae bacterium]
MLREIFSDVTPNTKFRKIAAIVLYVFFMLCILYTSNKKANASNAEMKRMNVVVSK